MAKSSVVFKAIDHLVYGKFVAKGGNTLAESRWFSLALAADNSFGFDHRYRAA